MGSWHTRASAASIAGACVFAVATGAGAVFVGDWYGSSHHGTVVTEFVTTSASPAHSSHPAGSPAARPAATGWHARTPGTEAQADAKTARVAGASPAAKGRHAKPPAAPAANGNRPGQDNGQGSGSGSQSPGPSPVTATATQTPTPVASPAPTATTGTGSSTSGNSSTDGSSGTASTAPQG